MPLFMQVWNVPSEYLTPDASVVARQREIPLEGKHGVRLVKYWNDAPAGKGFCLWDGPSKEAVEALTQEAHGVQANEMFQVFEGS